MWSSRRLRPLFLSRYAVEPHSLCLPHALRSSLACLLHIQEICSASTPSAHVRQTITHSPTSNAPTLILFECRAHQLWETSGCAASFVKTVVFVESPGAFAPFSTQVRVRERQHEHTPTSKSSRHQRVSSRHQRVHTSTTCDDLAAGARIGMSAVLEEDGR